jgi:microcystin-dependent protein
MSCSNCYNGCPQITSDQCVKYTGIDVPVLGIKNGDSLSYVEQAIITFLTSTLDGTGVKPKIEKSIICDVVKKYLPTCGDLTVVDFIKSLVQVVCELKTLVDGTITDITTINNFITSLEADYNINTCLTVTTPGLTPTSGTHAILQAVIARLCTFINIDADLTYVRRDEIDVIIQSYLSSLPAATKFYTRMVPYVAVPFFPTPAILGKFNNGVGQDEWEKIYFCNGSNLTPDLRGRVPVGVTDGTMGGGPLPAQTDPTFSTFNPTYAQNLPVGNNSFTLGVNEIPEHDHPGSTIVIDQDPHRHNYTTGSNDVDGWQGDSDVDDFGPITAQTDSATVTLRPTLTIARQGGSQPHPNIQPGLGCYYIMYIP